MGVHRGFIELGLAPPRSNLNGIADKVRTLQARLLTITGNELVFLPLKTLTSLNKEVRPIFALPAMFVFKSWC